MSNIVVKKDGEKWGAFYNDRRITGSACKPCVVKVLLTILKNSSKYKTITVMNEEGAPERTILIGVNA